ncbi:unnamed protein product, partial [Durusdinium trenchii]
MHPVMRHAFTPLPRATTTAARGALSGAPRGAEAPAQQVPLLRCVALAGGSVRAARRLVAQKRVYINGRRADDETLLVDNADVVTILKISKGSAVHVPTPPRCEYYMKLYKPYGVLCSQVRDRADAQLVADFYPTGAEQTCHNVGRLDLRSEGLLLFTSDGFFTRSVLMPETHIEKEYVVKLRMLDASCSFKCPGHEELSRLREGIDLGDGKDLAVALSAELLRCDADERSALLRLVVSNGRYHLVRRMCSALGYRCERLLRTRVGSITGVQPDVLLRDDDAAPMSSAGRPASEAEDLQPGEYAPLSPEEVKAVYLRGLEWLEQYHPQNIAVPCD